MSQRPEVMDCARVIEELERFVDDDLPRIASEAVQSHLESCVGCREELALTRAVRDGLRSLPAYDAPARVVERVKATARQSASEAGPAPWWRLRPSPVWALAAALALAAVLSPLMLSRDTPEPSPVATVEVERATEEVRLALAYLGRYSHRAGVEIRDGLIVERLVVPAAESLSSLRDAPGRGAQGERNET